MIELQNNSKLQFLFGEAILSALSDPQVTDVMVNPDGTLWLDTFDGRKPTGERLEANRIYNIICTVASLIDEVVNRAHPDIRAEIPFPVNENHQRLLRFQGAIPPIVRGPSFTIRIPSSRVFTLDEYLEAGALTWDQQEYLQAAIRNRRNILIVGNTGSGKTTFLNALIEEITGQNPQERIVTIEDTFELQVNVPNNVSFRSSEEIDMDRLLRNSLRNNPDRILVGEVRGKEALTMLKSWNTGHCGMCTIHANDALSGLIRIEQLIHEAGIMPVPEVIASTVNVVVYLEKNKFCKAGRCVSEIREVSGYDRRLRQYITTAIESLYGNSENERREFLYELMELN
mgnify:CR=1 FL=1